jgi:DNA-directed RNA polymerase subunit H (RpoH/RPB5)
MSIAPSEFIHPADKAALQALKAIPLFTPCLKAFLKTFSEEYFLGVNLAQKIRLGPGQLPKIYKHLTPICKKLGIEEREMPHIIRRANEDKLLVVPVLVGKCLLDDYPLLADRHMVPSSTPFIKVIESDVQWDEVRNEILVHLNPDYA